MDLDFDISRFRLEAIWRRFFPDIQLAGLIDSRGTLNGSFDRPIMTFSGSVAGFRYDDRPFGRLEFDAGYADQWLSVEQSRLKNPDFQIDVSGRFPIDLSFGPVAQRVLDRALEGRLSASGDVLDRIAAFQPEILESISGPFAVSANVSGTPRQPLLTGDAHLRAGRIKTLEIVNPIEEVTIDLSLRQDTIVITEATGRVRDHKESGTVSAEGRLHIESYDRFGYDLTLTGHDVPARFEFEDFAVVSDFDLTVKGSSPPRVTGTLRPSRVDDREPFADEPFTTLVEDTTIWDWDFDIEMPGNYWIHNDRIEAEMSAKLVLLRRRGLMNFIGTAEIIRGKVYFLDKVGRIQRGTLTFDDPNDPDPKLDIDVRFRIRQPRIAGASPGSSSDVVDLDLHVRGKASEPILEAQPPYTHQDFILLLTTNSTGVTSGNPLTNRLRDIGTGLLLSEAERIMADMMGLETLEIEPGSDAGDTQIRAGRSVSPQLFIHASSRINVGAGQELGFEYRFSRRLFLDGNRDRDNLYRLNLHFNWDY
jgi:autotransporter translocation and assembly factor TamB